MCDRNIEGVDLKEGFINVRHWYQPVTRVNTLATVSNSTHSIRRKKTFLMAHCVRVVSQFLFIGSVDLKIFSCIDIWSLFYHICEQMHLTDSYSKVTWSKPDELDGSMISSVTVWFSLLVIYSVPFLVWTPRLVKTSININTKDAL